MVRGYVVTFDDITELLSAQRQAAWAEVARRIAHEVKNPLTPIRLSAERLKRKYLAQIVEDREVFTNCTATIVRQVDVIGRLITEFSAFARMPATDARGGARGRPRARCACCSSRMPGRRSHFEVERRRAAGDARCATGQRSRRPSPTCCRTRSTRSPSAHGRGSRAIVIGRCVRRAEPSRHRDRGQRPRLAAADRERLFEPYVTTRGRGTGLGLAIVRKIMEEHGGAVELLASPAGGALVRLVFPSREAACTGRQISG